MAEDHVLRRLLLNDARRGKRIAIRRVLCQQRGINRQNLLRPRLRPVPQPGVQVAAPAARRTWSQLLRKLLARRHASQVERVSLPPWCSAKTKIDWA